MPVGLFPLHQPWLVKIRVLLTNIINAYVGLSNTIYISEEEDTEKIVHST